MRFSINSSSSKSRSAFSMLELIFVIVILAILGKFGVEFLAQAYNTFIFSSINSKLQSNSATAVEFISTRLQHRIKESVIARKTNGDFELLSSAGGTDYTILEWIGSDIDGFRGNSDAVGNPPNWSGVVDFNLGDANTIVSPMTDTNRTNILINTLSNGNSGINDAALFFIGSNIFRDGFGWNGVAITDQNQTMHPITTTANLNEFAPAVGTGPFSDVYEYYKLAWTAYAVVYEAGTNNKGELWLYYDYQPWEGENYKDDGKAELIMQNVDTFRYVSIGSLIKIQVCVKSDLVANEEYSICKEKTIY